MPPAFGSRRRWIALARRPPGRVSAAQIDHTNHTNTLALSIRCERKAPFVSFVWFVVQKGQRLRRAERSDASFRMRAAAQSSSSS
jgi:hypothetical protein